MLVEGEVEVGQVERRGRWRGAIGDRRQAERRTGDERRIATVEVEVERRVAGRRFVERRAAVRRRLNEGKHLAT